MFCSQCGKELPENSKFCLNCGNKINAVVSGNIGKTPKESEATTKIQTIKRVVNKNGHNIEQMIERTVEQPNLGSKNAEPQKQTQISKFKIIVWATVIFLIVLLVASSIFDLILYGLGLSTEFAGALACVTAGIFAGWYYLAEKEKKSKDQAVNAYPKKII